MSRINTNVASLLAQRVLGQNNLNLNTSLQRLATGIRINRGKDDPAGLIASENLRSQLAGANAAIGNAERADQVVNIAEGGLQEVSGLLTELQGLITTTANTAGLSEEEKEANQLQIDSILQTIDRVSTSTNFQGVKLLNGTFDYDTTNIDAGVTDVSVNGAKFSGDTLDVDVIVTQSAHQGKLAFDFGGAAVDLQGNTDSAFVFEVSGALGAREMQFSSGTSAADVAAAINTFTDVTGVQATDNASGVVLNAVGYGDSKFVSVKVIDDGGIAGTGIYDFLADDNNTIDGVVSTFAAATNGVKDEGQDIGANINGVAATSDGRTIKINTDVLNIELSMDTTTSQTLGAVSALTIEGGGADFMLGGTVDISNKVSLGIGEVAARKLGQTEDGDNAGSFFFLDDLGSGKGLNVVDGSLEDAQKVVAEAIGEVSSLRGRLGAFQKNVVGATIRSLGVSVENTAAADSVIRDADFAKETANLTRSQILTQAATNSLILANQTPQLALQLLG